MIQHPGPGEDEFRFSGDASGFVVLGDLIPDVIQEIRYYSSFNFVGARIDGYEEPVALLTSEAAEALKQVCAQAARFGYRLKIFDAYRPQQAVDHFMRWAADPADTRMKPFFYPDLDKESLIPGGYIARRSGHSRGSTVDLTLFDMSQGSDADMGGPFDWFGELSHPDSRAVAPEQRARRLLLRELMTRAGFRPLESEWWHFTLADEPYPDTIFTFPVSRSAITKR